MRNLRDYLWPGSPQEALDLLQRHSGVGSLLAGGTALAEDGDPELDFVIDISRLGLGGVTREGPWMRIGATTSLQELAESVEIRSLANGILHEALQHTRTDPWRRQATIAGRLHEADPFDRILPVCLVLEASVLLLQTRQSEPQEFSLTEALVPTTTQRLWLEIRLHEIASGWRFALESLSRSALDTPLVTVVVATRCTDGRIDEARVALSGVHPAPARSSHAEQSLVGFDCTNEDFRPAQDALLVDLRPIDDHRASSDYREHLARTLFARALRRSLEDSRNGGDDAPTT